MEEMLLNAAAQAFAAIEQNTGEIFWNPSTGLKGAIDGFNNAAAMFGLAGLIDAASGTGMGHAGLALWLEEAQKITAN